MIYVVANMLIYLFVLYQTCVRRFCHCCWHLHWGNIVS